MDLTPKKPPKPWWPSLGSCCAAPAARCADEDDAVKSRTGTDNCPVRWLSRNDAEKREMVRRIGSLSAQVARAEDELHDARGAARRAQEGLESTARCRDELLTEQASLREELATKMREIAAANDALLHENEMLLGAVADAIGARDNLQKELDTATTTSAAFKDSLEAKEVVVENLNEILDQLNLKILESNKYCAAKTAEVKSLQISLAAVTLSRHELWTSQESMQKDVEDLTTKMDEVSAANNALRRENDLLRGKVVPAAKHSLLREVVTGSDELERSVPNGAKEAATADADSLDVEETGDRTARPTVRSVQVASCVAAATQDPIVLERGEPKKKARRKLTPRTTSESAAVEEGELGFGDIASVRADSLGSTP